MTEMDYVMGGMVGAGNGPAPPTKETQEGNMKIIDPSHEILDITREPLKLIERVARDCYDSEAGDFEKTKKFVKAIISKKHEAMLEFADMTVRFITDRAVSHELVRHRIASFAQRSQRYCVEDLNTGGVRFVKPD